MSLQTYMIGLLTLLALTSVRAQQPSFVHFGTGEGLPSGMVYDIIQDREGYIWLATESGLSRYNGHEFYNFSHSDGMMGTDVIRLKEDSRGRIWLCNYNSTIEFWHQGQFYNPGNVPALASIELQSFPLMTEEDARGNIYFITKSELVSIDPEVSTARVTSYPNLDYLYRDANGQISLISRAGKVFSPEPETPSIDFNLFNRVGRTLYLPPHHLFRVTTDSIYLLDLASQRTLFRQKNAHEKMPTRIDAHNAGETWVLSWSGVQVFQGVDMGGAPSRSLLAGKPVSASLMDREGNLWLATLGEGVYMSPNPVERTWRTSDGLPVNQVDQLLLDEEGVLWLGFPGGKVGYLKNGQFNPIESTAPEGKNENRCMGIIKGPDGAVWWMHDYAISILREGKIDWIPLQGKGISIDPDGNVWINSYGGSFPTPYDRLPQDIEARGSAYRILIDLGVKGTARELVTLPNGEVVAATASGLKVCQGHQLYLWKDSPLFQNSINDLDLGANGELAVSIHGNGIALFLSDTLLTLDRSGGLTSDYGVRVRLEGDSVLWVGSNAGLNRVVFSSRGWKELRKYTQEDGLASNRVTDMAPNGDSIWVATHGGLSYLPVRPPRSPDHIPLKITQVKSQGTPFFPSEPIHLPYNQNSLTITYDGLYFRNPDRLHFRYQMGESDTTFHTTQQRQVEFPSLASGDYTFHLECSADGKNWFAAENDLKISVATPYYRKWWFFLTLVLGSGMLFTLAITWQSRSVRARNKLRRQADEFKDLALRAQINPHFIFNSLNSIQQFVARKDEHSALLYLSKFSRLIRMTLENTRSSNLNLSEELKALQFYLELESLRVGERLSFEILYPVDLEADNIIIPGMVIQPLAENGIWHGILLKDGPGKLSIRISEPSPARIQIVVEDDGIGRKAAAKYQQQKGHQSIGVDNIRKRLDLFGAEFGGPAQLVIEDLYDDGLPSGTRCTIQIPKIQSFFP